MILCLSCTWWAFTEFGYRQADSIEEATFWLKLNGFWPLTVAIFLHLSLVITEQKKFLQRKLLYLLIYLPAFVFIAFDFFPAIPLSDTIMAPWGCWTYKLNNNIFVWIIQLWSYIVAGVSLFLYLQYYRQSKNYKKKQQIKYISIALAFPVFTSLLEEFLLPYFGYSVPELIVPSMASGFVFIGYAICKHELFEITPSVVADDIFSAMAEGIVLITPDGQIVKANSAAERILGLKRSKIESRNYIAPEWKILRPNGTPMPPEEMAGPRAMKEKRLVKDIVMGVKRPDGLVSWITVTATPLISDNNKFEGVVGTFSDITKRKQNEEALKESEEKFRSLTETTSDWVWEVDYNGVYTYASPKVKDLLGYEPEEIIGKTPFDLMPSDEAKRIAEEFGAIVKAKKSFDRLENVNLHKNGKRIVLETSGVPILDESENFLGYRGIDRDITERKQLQERLFQAEKLSSLSTMLSGLAHNINNPLFMATGRLDLLKKSENLSKKQHEVIKVIERQIERIGSLTKEMLELGYYKST